MPKFVKIFLTSNSCKKSVWMLLIDNEVVLEKFYSHEAHLNITTLMGMEVDNDGHVALGHTGAQSVRAITIQRWLSLKQITANGEKVYPIIEIAKMTDEKYLTMYELIGDGGTILVNSSGGYSDYNGFIKTWDGEILEEIEKPDFGFPVDDDVIKADTIVLENSHRDYKSIDNGLIKRIPQAGIVAGLYNLKEIDRGYVMKCLENCKNVVIQSTLMDNEQLDGFMKMFTLLSPKQVYLTIYGNGMSKLKLHSLWNTVSNKHTIIFDNDI